MCQEAGQGIGLNLAAMRERGQLTFEKPQTLSIQ